MVGRSALRRRAAGLALATATLAGPAHAADAPIGLIGRWTLDLARSHFDEAVTGPAPTAAELDVTKDDGRTLAWTLVEEDPDGLAAFQFADAPLDGRSVRAVANDHFVPISVTREGANGVRIRAGGNGAATQEFVGRLIAPDTLTMDEHFITPQGVGTQSMIFRRQP